MGEGYGCSNFQCSTLANAIKFIHSCRRAAVVHQIGSLFVHQIKDDTPILNRQITKEKGLTCTVHNSWVTMHALHVK